MNLNSELLSYDKYYNGKKEWAVFIPGLGGAPSTWGKQIKEFSKHYNLLLPYMHGHGKSVNVKLSIYNNPSLDIVAEDVMRVLDSEGIEKAHFIAMSSGTMVLPAIADLYPKRVLSLILSGAAIRYRARLKVLFAIGNWFRNLLPYMFLYNFFAFVVMPRKNHKISRKFFVQEAHKLPKREFFAWFDLTQRFEKDFPIKRHHSPVPKLYIIGDEDHMFNEPVMRLAPLDKYAEVYVVPHCGHVCNIDRRDEFNKAALEFMGEHCENAQIQEVENRAAADTTVING